jgi:hypothetical protein
MAVRRFVGIETGPNRVRHRSSVGVAKVKACCTPEM